MTREVTFPATFTWGAATAAFQIEGAAHEGGRTDSIWDVFCREDGAVVGGDTGDVACDHYHRMPDDVALLADLGFGAYRFSTSWARVCPDGGAPNAEGLAFYDRLVDEVLARGMEPWLTLYHWDLPAAIPGGWTNRDTADRFTEYALATFDALGDRVDTWTTLNEPWCASFLSYAGGVHAPGHTDPTEAVEAAHHLLLAHGRATRALRERASTRHRLGITLNYIPAIPANRANPEDVEAARMIEGAQLRVFLEPLLAGSYPADVLFDMADAGLGANAQAGDMETIAAPIDFLGLNFYNGALVAAPDPADESPLDVSGPGGRTLRSPYVGSERVRWVSRGLPRTAMDWEVHAPDLRNLLVDLHQRYTGPAGIPLYVTENGAAYDDVVRADGSVHDPERADYYRTHLAAVGEAIRAGADVRGYFAWSLLDNFEWAFGYSKRFGIVHVDYETQVRTPKSSARFLAGVARSNSVTIDEEE